MINVPRGTFISPNNSRILRIMTVIFVGFIYPQDSSLQATYYKAENIMAGNFIYINPDNLLIIGVNFALCFCDYYVIYLIIGVFRKNREFMNNAGYIFLCE